MLARGEDRGIGIQTWEWWRHVQPASTLLVDLGDLARNFARHPDRFPGATHAALRGDGTFDEAVVRAWLEPLDVLYTVETFYDWRIVDWACREGVRTVVHCNPEFYRHGRDVLLPEPDAWWLPTTWRAGLVDHGARVVEVPVPLDRWPTPEYEQPRDPEEPLRILHVVGHRAMGDRNGTRALLQALRLVKSHVRVTLATQDARLPSARFRHNIEVVQAMGGVDDYWTMYAGHDVLVMPRRYGGLCLPVLEASGAGLAVVMTDVSPQRDDWPHVIGVPVIARPIIETPAGRIPTWDAHPMSLAETIDTLAQNPDVLRDAQRAARRWAERQAWDSNVARITTELAACH